MISRWLFLFCACWVTNLDASEIPAEIAEIYSSLRTKYPETLKLDGTNYPQPVWRKTFEETLSKDFDSKQTLEDLQILLNEARRIYQSHIFSLPYIKDTELLDIWGDLSDIPLGLFSGTGGFFYKGRITVGDAMAACAPSRATRIFLLGHELKHAGARVPDGLNSQMKKTGVFYVDHSKEERNSVQSKRRNTLYWALGGLENLPGPGLTHAVTLTEEDVRKDPVLSDGAHIFKLLGVDTKKERERRKKVLDSFNLGLSDPSDNPLSKKPDGIAPDEGEGTKVYSILQPLVAKMKDEKVLKEIIVILSKYGGLVDQREEFAADFLASKVVVEFIRGTYRTPELQRQAAFSVLYYFHPDFETELQRDLMSLVGSKLPWERRVNILLTNKDFQKLLLLKDGNGPD